MAQASSLPRLTAASAAALSSAVSVSAIATSHTMRPAFCRHMPRTAVAALPKKPCAPGSSRAFHAVSSASRPGRRPLQQQQQPQLSQRQQAQQPWWALGGRGRRTIFIQTENTPNADALKFLPNHQVLPASIKTPFVEYLSPRSTIAPPYPSPLAAQLMNVDGVKAVFYGSDFITVTKASDANWAHIRPEVFSLITEAITSGQAIVRHEAGSAAAGAKDGAATSDNGDSAAAAASGDADAAPTGDSLSYDENDSEVVGMIKELLETRIRPAIQEDGGDIEFRGFEDGHVRLKLRGACRTCDSSTVTLKNGIESMLMHYIEEVKGVTQVLDQEEEVALREFAKFEEKLKQQHAAAAAVPPSSGNDAMQNAAHT